MGQKNTKKIIVDTAVNLIASDGLSVSLRKIAKIAGVSPGLIIHHFGSRDELVSDAVQSCLENLLDKKKSFDSESWSSGLVGLFLEISEPELNLIRRVLVDDTQVAADLFSSSMKHASQYLSQTNPDLDRKKLKLQAAVLAAQALGSVIMLPQLLKVVKAADLSSLTDSVPSQNASLEKSVRK